MMCMLVILLIILLIILFCVMPLFEEMFSDLICFLQRYGKCLDFGKSKVIKRLKKSRYSQEEIETSICTISEFANKIIKEYEIDMKFHIRYCRKTLNAQAIKNRVFLNWKWVEKYLLQKSNIDKMELIIRHEIGHIVNKDKEYSNVTATNRVYSMACEVLADNVAKIGFSKGLEEAERVFVEKTEDVKISKFDLFIQKYMPTHPNKNLRIKLFKAYNDIHKEQVIEIIELLKKEYGFKYVKTEKVMKKLGY